MTLAAAVSIDSDDAPWIIAKAARYAGRDDFWYVISVVPFLPHGVVTDSERARVERNLALAAARNGRPIMQEGSNIAQCIVCIGRSFGIDALVVGPGRHHVLRRSVTEELLRLDRPFDLIVVTQL
jgi:K+-sensing histidine kinase KdpD